jgi:hypothetical protein
MVVQSYVLDPILKDQSSSGPLEATVEWLKRKAIKDLNYKQCNDKETSKKPSPNTTWIFGMIQKMNLKLILVVLLRVMIYVHDIVSEQYSRRVGLNI